MAATSAFLSTKGKLSCQGPVVTFIECTPDLSLLANLSLSFDEFM